MEWFEQAEVGVCEKMLRAFGHAPRPRVQMFADGDDMRQAYLGYVECRPWRWPVDCMAAVTAMGPAARAFGGARLLWSWENATLFAGFAGQVVAPGIATVDVTPAGHVVVWRPYTLTGDFDVRWGQEQVIEGGPLPSPVATAVNHWLHAPPMRDPRAVLTGSGYRYALTERGATVPV